jgi:hypothetical protein
MTIPILLHTHTSFFLPNLIPSPRHKSPALSPKSPKQPSPSHKTQIPHHIPKCKPPIPISNTNVQIGKPSPSLISPKPSPKHPKSQIPRIQVQNDKSPNPPAPAYRILLRYGHSANPVTMQTCRKRLSQATVLDDCLLQAHSIAGTRLASIRAQNLSKPVTLHINSLSVYRCSMTSQY